MRSGKVQKLEALVEELRSDRSRLHEQITKKNEEIVALNKRINELSSDLTSAIWHRTLAEKKYEVLDRMMGQIFNKLDVSRSVSGMMPVAQQMGANGYSAPVVQSPFNFTETLNQVHSISSRP